MAEMAAHELSGLVERARALEGQRHERYRQVVRRAAEQARAELEAALRQRDWSLVDRAHRMFIGVIAGVDEAWVRAVPLPDSAPLATGESV